MLRWWSVLCLLAACATAGAECPSGAFALGGGQCEACPAGQTRDTSLVSWLRFETGEALNYDSTTGAEVGHQSGNAQQISHGTGVLGSAVAFSKDDSENWGDSYIRLSNTDFDFNSQAWSIAFFAKVVSGGENPSWGFTFSLLTFNSGELWGVSKNHEGSARMTSRSLTCQNSQNSDAEPFVTPRSNNRPFNMRTDIPLSEYVHYVVTFSCVKEVESGLCDVPNSQLQIFYAGTFYAVCTFPSSVTDDGANSHLFFSVGDMGGAAGSDLDGEGSVDDLRVYNRVLSATEVAALANQPTTGNEVWACAECTPGDSSAGCGCAADSYLGPASSPSALCLAQFDKTGTSAYSDGCKFRLGGAKSVAWTATLDLAPGFLDITFRSDEAADRDTNDPLFIQINGAEVYRKQNDGCEPTWCEDTIPWPGPATISITATSSTSTLSKHSSIESLTHRASLCLACPAGKTAPSGSTSDTNCTCAPGSYLDTSGGEESCATCPSNTYKSTSGDDVGLCLTCPAGSTIKDTPSAPAAHTSAAECECAAGTYGVPGDVHEYRIVRTDGRAGPVVFADVRFLDESGGEVAIYAEDPAPRGG